MDDTLPVGASVQEQQQVHAAVQRQHQHGVVLSLRVDGEVLPPLLSVVRGGMPKGYPREDLFFEGGTW